MTRTPAAPPSLPAVRKQRDAPDYYSLIVVVVVATGPALGVDDGEASLVGAAEARRNVRHRVAAAATAAVREHSSLRVRPDATELRRRRRERRAAPSARSTLLFFVVVNNLMFNDDSSLCDSPSLVAKRRSLPLQRQKRRRRRVVQRNALVEIAWPLVPARCRLRFFRRRVVVVIFFVFIIERGEALDGVLAPARSFEGAGARGLELVGGADATRVARDGYRVERRVAARVHLERKHPRKALARRPAPPGLPHGVQPRARRRPAEHL